MNAITQNPSSRKPFDDRAAALAVIHDFGGFSSVYVSRHVERVLARLGAAAFRDFVLCEIAASLEAEERRAARP